MFTFFTQLTPDYKIDEKNSINSVQHDSYIATDEEIYDISATYIVNKSLYDNHLSQVKSLLHSFTRIDAANDNFINHNILSSSLKIIENISPIILEKIDLHNIYPSNYETIVMEWENNDNLFTLEIGKTTIGYFTEIDDVFSIKTESSSIVKDECSDTLKKLTKDIENFYLY